MDKEIVNFSVSTALKNLIGKELITNDYVAVFELVKNSFDARSSNVKVTFNLQKGTISIHDDGNGMSYDDVKNKWLFIGYSEKKDSPKELFSGSKGIGRFSCDRLGKTLSLITVKNGIETSLLVDWESFEVNQLEKIENHKIPIFKQETSKQNGTILEISDLRKNWTEKDIKKTKDQLLKLLSPHSIDNRCALELEYLDQNGVLVEASVLKNDVFDYMKEKVIYVKTTFDELKITTELFDHGRKIINNISENHTLVSSATISLFFADKSAKTIFKKKTGFDLIDYGNLFVYKNNFRIYPFGDRGYDVFGLSQRKAQGMYRFLGPREIIGWISLIDKENHFIEATSRDRGFLDNEYSLSLQDAYMEFAHRPLEKYVELLKYGNISLDEFLDLSAADTVLKEISHSFTLKDSVSVTLDETLLESKVGENELLKLQQIDLPKKERDVIIKKAVEQIRNNKNESIKNSQEIQKLKGENKALQNEIIAKNKFIEIENPSRQDVLEHDLGLVSRRLKTTLDGLFELNKKIDNKNLESYIVSIAKNIYRINSIRNFILKTKMNTKTKKDIEVGSFLKEYSNSIDFEQITIKVSINNDFVLKCNPFDLITIFDNFVSNVYNLDGTTINIYVSENSIKFVSDTFDNNKNVDFNRVFDYGYSTTSGGTGIGMFIIKQVCKEYGLSVKMGRVKETNLVEMEITKNA